MPEITQEQYNEIVATLQENIELKTDLKDAKALIMGFLKLMGLSDGTIIYQEYLLDKEHPDYKNPMKPVINAMTQFTTTAVKAKMPGIIGKKAEQEMREAFAFVEQHYHLIEKYGRR